MGRLQVQAVNDTDKSLGASFDKYATVDWVGQICLENMAPTPVSAVSRKEFLNSWKDLLPESWRNEGSWDSLKVCLKSFVAYTPQYLIAAEAYKN